MTRLSTALVLAAALALGGCGGGGSRTAARPATEAVKNALVARLQHKQLSYRWIVCVNDGRSFRGHPVVRCNVSFGEPHIEVYCAILDHGRLETNFDDPTIRCGHEGAGSSPPTATS